MEPTKPLIIGAFLLFGLPMLAQAQKIYSCKDASGRTITSDRPMPECANRPMKELNNSGMVKREIPVPLTGAEIRIKKETEDKRKADEAAAIEQRRRDLTLLQTYKSEQQIMLERQQSLIQLRNNVNIALTGKAAAEKKQKAAQLEADGFKAKGAPIPTFVKTKITDAERMAQQEGKNAETYEAEINKEKTKYDDLIARYRAVSGADNK
jgi:hypothetical protein